MDDDALKGFYTGLIHLKIYVIYLDKAVCVTQKQTPLCSKLEFALSAAVDEDLSLRAVNVHYVKKSYECTRLSGSVF